MHTGNTQRITVLGGGAWGTSLALHCARKGHDVLLWAREEEVVKGVNERHENSLYFKVRQNGSLVHLGIFPPLIHCT